MKKSILMLLVLLLSFSIAPFYMPAVYSQPQERLWWTMYMGCPERNGVAADGPEEPNILWKYEDGAKHWGQILVYKDRVIYGERNGLVHCLEEFTGKWIWSFPTGGPIYSTPCVWEGTDGRTYVFIGSYDNIMYALDFYTGELIWQFETAGAIMTPPLVYNGKLYFGSKDYFMYCVNATTGELIWQFETGGQVRGPAALGNGKLYWASYDGKVYCLDPDTGNKLWEFNTGGAPFGVTFHDGVVYVVGDITGGGSTLYALNAETGEVIWQYKFGRGLYNQPLVIPEGYVIVKEYKPDAKIIAVNKDTGEVAWEFQGSGPFYQHVVYAEGRLYFGTDHAILYCLNASTGEMLWNLTVFGADVQDVSFGDGILFVGSNDGFIYAIGTLPPAIVTILKPLEAGWSTGDVEVEWLVQGVGLEKIEIYLDGERIAANIPVNQTTYTLTGLTTGSHNVTIVVYNVRGETTSASRIFNVDVTPPTITITSPKSGETIPQTEFTATWTASDEGAGIDKFEVYLDGQLHETTTSTTSVFAKVPEGEHELKIVAYDKAGNKAEAVVKFKIEIPFMTKYGNLIAAAVIIIILIIVFVFLKIRKAKPRKEEETKK